MYKLHKLGIRGRMWKWIKSFLNGRKVFINMKGDKGREFKTAFGLPQGCVISALLFILFIVDCFENVKSKKVKFADDGTIWITGKNWMELIKQLEEDFTKITILANKWRLKISILKTEFCVFSLINQVLEDARLYTMKLKGQVIKYNPKSQDHGSDPR